MTPAEYYCASGCLVYSECKRNNPEKCEIYKSAQNLIQLVDNMSAEDKQRITGAAESYLSKAKKINDLAQELLEDLD